MDPNLFPELNLSILKMLATTWANKYKVIKKIELYRSNDPMSEYVLVVTGPSDCNFDDPDFPRNDYEKLTLNYHNSIYPNCLHIEKHLAKAYRGKPPCDYRNQWYWYHIEEEEEQQEDVLLNKLITKGFSCVLYEKLGNSYSIDSPKIKRVAEKAYPEIIEIYEAIKKEGLSKNEESLKKAAMDYFDKNKGRFKFINKKLLEKDVFTLNRGKERRDFVGRVLQNLLIIHQLGKFNYQKLSTLYGKGPATD